MTNTQNLTREEAEAAARAGAKVRHEKWGDGWVAYHGDMLLDEKGEETFLTDDTFLATGWSIVTPAPDAGQPDTAKAETDAKPREYWVDWADNVIMKYRAEHNPADFPGLIHVREVLPEPTFTTTRKTPPDDVRVVLWAEELSRFIWARGQPRRGAGVTVAEFCRRHPCNRADVEVALSHLLNSGAIAIDANMNLFSIVVPEPADPEPATNPHPEGSRKAKRKKWGPWQPPIIGAKTFQEYWQGHGMVQIERDKNGYIKRYRLPA